MIPKNLVLATCGTGAKGDYVSGLPGDGKCFFGF